MSTDDGAAPAGTRRAAVADREDAVVARLQALAADLDDRPDPAFRSATRDRLVAMAAVRTPEPARRSPLRRLLAARADGGPAPAWRIRLTAGLAGAALTVTALGTLVALATGAGPGDVLYGLKRGTEQTQLALAGDDRGLTLLQFAATRLDELAALPADGPADVAVGVLDAMDAQTTEGVALLTTEAVRAADVAHVDELAGWAAGQSSELAEVRPGVPAGADAAAQESADLLAAVTARAAELRTALDCPAGPATEGIDRLGPMPAACVAETPEAPPRPAGAPPSGAGELFTTAAPPPAGAASTPPSAPAPETPPGGGGTGTSGAAPTPDAGRPAGPPSTAPAPAVPLPGGGGLPLPPLPLPTEPPAPPPTPTPPPPIDTRLPICLLPLIC